MSSSNPMSAEKQPVTQDALVVAPQHPLPLPDQRIAALVIHYIDPVVTTSCLQSLSEASTIVVWDNTEDNGTSLAALKKALPEAVSARCIFAAQGVNLGFARGMNRAQHELLRHCNPEYIVAVNNDAVVSQGCLGKLADALHDPKAALAGANVQTRGRATGLFHYHRYTGLITKNRLPGSFPYLCGCCLMWRTADYPTGPFDEAFFMYGEDTELSWRAQRTGKHLTMVESAIVTHAGGSSSDPRGKFYEMQTARMHYLLARKLAENRLELALFMLGRCLSLPARALLRAVRHRSFVPITALWRGSRGMTSSPLSRTS